MMIADTSHWRDIGSWLLAGLVLMLVMSLLVMVCEVFARYAAKPPPGRPPPAAQAHPLDPLIARIAARHMPPDWDWRLLKAMIRQESNYDPRARSPGGAVGLCQMLPSTARHLGLSSAQFFDAEDNLDAGTRYLRQLYDRFHDVPDRAPDWERTRLAIASYNAGPGRVRRDLRSAGARSWRAVSEHLPSSTRHHVHQIVEEFYPSFRDVAQTSNKPKIGNWKPHLRFWPDERPRFLTGRSQPDS